MHGVQLDCAADFIIYTRLFLLFTTVSYLYSLLYQQQLSRKGKSLQTSKLLKLFWVRTRVLVLAVTRRWLDEQWVSPTFYAEIKWALPSMQKLKWNVKFLVSLKHSASCKWHQCSNDQMFVRLNDIKNCSRFIFESKRWRGWHIALERRE